MFDFDELSGEENELHENGGSKPSESQPSQLPVALKETSRVESSSSSTQQARVSVSHAIHGWTITVILPEKALFKHLRDALAKHFLKDSASFSGQLMHKEGGVYRPYKDKDAVGSIQEVLLTGFDGDAPEDGLEIHVKEEDLKDIFEESLKPTSLEGFLILQRELKEGFADENFQEKLRQLQQKCEEGELSKTKLIAERQKLFLTVQSKILPRHGYEGSSNGVYKMMGDMKPYIKDAQFIELADEINTLLGIGYSPSESWESLSDNCQKLNDEKVSRPDGAVQGRQPRGYAHDLRPPMGLLGPVPSLLNGKPLRLPDFILGNP